MSRKEVLKFTIRLSEPDGSAARFQQEAAGKFAQGHSLKLLASGTCYHLELSIQDLVEPSSFEGIVHVHLDDERMEVLQQSDATIRCKWMLSSLHFTPTPHGVRDYIPLKVSYRYAGEIFALSFYLQAKLYSKTSSKRLARAKSGAPLGHATCVFDASRDAADGVRPQSQGLQRSALDESKGRALEWSFMDADLLHPVSSSKRDARPQGQAPPARPPPALPPTAGRGPEGDAVAVAAALPNVTDTRLEGSSAGLPGVVSSSVEETVELS